MEEEELAGCGGLLQLARRRDCDHTRNSHRNSRVAVGTRRSETEGHPFDASGDGLHVERPDLCGVVHPHENPTETRRDPAGIPLADRSRGRGYRRTDRTLGWISQRSERTRIGAFQNRETDVHWPLTELVNGTAGWSTKHWRRLQKRRRKSKNREGEERNPRRTRTETEEFRRYTLPSLRFGALSGVGLQTQGDVHGRHRCATLTSPSQLPE